MPVFKQWLLARKPEKGVPTVDEHFEMNEDHLPDMRKGEILCRALFLSVDPITRLYMAYGMNEQDVIPGRQVARVIESKNRDFCKGRLIVGSLGWQSYSIVNPDATLTMAGREVPVVENLPKQIELSGQPKSSVLGVFGVPGITAYTSLIHGCKIKEGETIVISSAAGQIGHLLGQIAVMKGLKVVGYTNDSDKASWMKLELGYEWAFNYDMIDLKQSLKISVPNGIDVFVDAVGGIFHQTVLEYMSPGGRVCILGNLSQYNNPRNVPMVHANDMAIALKELHIFGFNVYRYWEYRDEALDHLSEWCKSGDLKPYEHIVEGFENMPKAFIDQLSGRSQGKVIVRV